MGMTDYFVTNCHDKIVYLTCQPDEAGRRRPKMVEFLSMEESDSSQLWLQKSIQKACLKRNSWALKASMIQARIYFHPNEVG